MQESIVFLVRVQCRHKESSRSLSHLLMSFLLALSRRPSGRRQRTTRNVMTAATISVRNKGLVRMEQTPQKYEGPM